MHHKNFFRFFCVVLVLLLTSTCDQLLQDQLSSITPSPTFMAVPTFAPTLFAYLTPSVTQEPFVPFEARTFYYSVAFTGPGGVFSEVTRIQRNTNLLILGKSIGGEWVHVQLPSNEKGWISADNLQLGVRYLPTIQPENAQMVIGRVVDESGQPVNGVHISIFRFVEDYSIGTGGTTDSQGFLYSFMPRDANGEWLVWYDSLACHSNKMPPGCTCPQRKCGQPYPQTTTVILPQTSRLLFIWK